MQVTSKLVFGVIKKFRFLMVLFHLRYRMPVHYLETYEWYCTRNFKHEYDVPNTVQLGFERLSEKDVSA